MGLRLACLEVVPPRSRWSLSATETPRNPARKQSTVPYARSMGGQNTHNTGDCHKYEKDGTPKKYFTGKSTQQRNPHNRNAPCKHNNGYLQLSVKITKLEKSNKKLKRMIKKHKCNCDRDNNDSDSS